MRTAGYLNAGRGFSGFIYDRCLVEELFFAPNPGNSGVRVCLLEEAGFCPCGPEPSCGYVTETSHPDVELRESLRWCSAATCAQPVDRFYKLGSVCVKSASGPAAEPEICLSTVKLTAQLPCNAARTQAWRLMFNSEQHSVNLDMDG